MDSFGVVSYRLILNYWDDIIWRILLLTIIIITVIVRPNLPIRMNQEGNKSSKKNKLLPFEKKSTIAEPTNRKNSHKRGGNAGNFIVIFNIIRVILDFKILKSQQRFRLNFALRRYAQSNLSYICSLCILK